MSRNILTRFCVLLGAVAFVWAVSGVAMGEVLFYDSYNTTVQSTTDINFEIATRTSGTYGGGLTTYNEYTDNNGTYAVGTTVLQLNGVDGKEYIWIDRNFNGTDSAGGLDVSFSAKLTMTTENMDKWFDVTVGGSDATDHRPMNDGLCCFLRGSGAATCRERIGGSTGGTSQNFTWVGDDGNYHDFLLEIRGVGDDNPFDGTNALSMTMYIDGGLAVSYTTTAMSCADNYIGFEVCDDAQLYLEDLTVTRIPEPSTLALLAIGLVGLLAYGWKKRK